MQKENFLGSFLDGNFYRVDNGFIFLAFGEGKSAWFGGDDINFLLGHSILFDNNLYSLGDFCLGFEVHDNSRFFGADRLSFDIGL